MSKSPPVKSKSRPRYIEKPGSSNPPAEQPGPAAVNKPRLSTQEYFFVLEGTGDLTEAELKQIAGEQVVGVTVRNRRIRSLQLLGCFPDLRWIELIDCGLTDIDIGRLRAVKKLETMVLSGNNIASTKGFEPLKECKDLSCILLDNNPISSAQDKLEALRKMLQLDLLISEDSPSSIVALDIKRECSLAEYRSTRHGQLANSLIRDVFDMDNRVCVDLKKYLQQLKESKSSLDVAYEFLLSVKHFEQSTPAITQRYQFVPWVMIEEWPENNFLKQYEKALPTLPELLELVEQKDPAALVQARNLDHIVHHLLDEYYALELARLFRATRDSFDHNSVEKLVKFVFEQAVRYFQRNDELYRRFVNYTYGKESTANELTMLLLKNKQLLQGLELVITQPDKHYSPAEDAKVDETLRSIKQVKVERLVNESRGFSSKSLPFSDGNLTFFNGVLETIQETKVLFDIAKVDRKQLFSDILFDEFNVRDYQDLAVFLKEGEPKSEQYFSSCIEQLMLVTRLYEWFNDLEELQAKMLKVPEEEKYTVTAIYFKRLLGRPKVGIRNLRRYFSYFDFGFMEKLVDSEARVSSLKLLMVEFHNDFSFLVRFLIEGHKNVEFDRMKEACKRMAKPDAEQRSFMISAVKMLSRVDHDIKENSFFEECLTDPEQGNFPLLSYSLKNSTDEKYIQQLYEITSKTKLFNYEKKYLLDSLRQLIACDEKDVWLKNRSGGAFLLLIRKLNDRRLYDDNELLVRLLEFSNDMYGFLLNETSAKRKHKGQLDPVELESVTTVQKYFAALQRGNVMSDILLDILKDELYEVMFSWEQGWLTFNIIRYRQLCRLPIIEEFVGKGVLELLDLIEKNSVTDFVEIKVEPSIDWDDEEYVHDYMVSHILTPGKSKQDQFYLQNLREAYYDGIVKICLKKDMANLAEYLPKMEKVEDSFLKKGSTKISIPLLEISEIVKHRLFKNSELSRKLIYYFKSKVKTDEGSREIREEYKQLMARIDEDKRNDKELLRLLTIAIQKNQTRVFAAFLENLDLFIDIKEHAKIYFLIDWQLFESYHEHNHQKRWEGPSMAYLEDEMARHQRIFLKYLIKPFECKSQKSIVQHAFSRYQDLILNFEIDCIIDAVSEELGIKYPKKYGFRMIANKIHQFFSELHNRYPAQIPWLSFFNFDFCTAVKKRIGHAGFIDIKEHFCKAFTRKPRLEPITQELGFRMEVFEADKIIEKIDDQRSFNPADYLEKLVEGINSLAQINWVNPDIEKDIVKGRYQQIPWYFLNLKDQLRKPYWQKIFERVEQKLGVYLQLLHYLETEDKSETEGLKTLVKLFELVHSQICANDLIRRIQEILRLQKHPLLPVVLDFNAFSACPEAKLKELKEGFNKLESSATVDFSRAELLSTLRVFALRGQYLTRLQKINNKLRNLLSDFDEASLDLTDFFKKSAQPKNQAELYGSMMKMLSILFRYKFAFFDILRRQKYLELRELSLTREFVKYRQVDLKLKQIETVNRESVLIYLGGLLKRYQQNVTPDLKFLSANYQQAQLYHIAFFTSIRDAEKYEYVCSVTPAIRELLDSRKEDCRLYRNYLAHYNCCDTLQRKEGDKLIVMDDLHRQDYLKSFDAIVRKVAQLWK